MRIDHMLINLSVRDFLEARKTTYKTGTPPISWCLEIYMKPYNFPDSHWMWPVCGENEIAVDEKRNIAFWSIEL